MWRKSPAWRLASYDVRAAATTSSSSSFSIPSRGGRLVDAAAADGELRVFVVAGEVSGDSIASRLMSSLRRFSPLPVRFSGVGGSSMCKEGLRSLFPMEDISVMGIWELLPHIKKIKDKIEETARQAMNFQPHVVVTVDSKGFSFRLLRKLRDKYSHQRINSPLHVHYVAPSFWAWKGGEARLRQLSSFIDHILCILPFEEGICLQNGIAATFVGHPMLEDVLNLDLELDLQLNKTKFQGDGERFMEKHGLIDGADVFTILPGSRLQEVTRILPIFFHTMQLLKKSFPNLCAVIPVAPNQHVKAYVEEVVQKAPISCILVDGASVKQKYDAFRGSRIALCTSGTAVMELLLAQLPCVVAYRAHLLTEWIIRLRANQRFISLPNILLDTAAIPEALFQACNPRYLSQLVNQVLSDPEMQEKQISAREEIIRVLRSPKVDFGDLLASDIRSSMTSCSPSFLAAMTILYSVKKP